VKLEVRQGYGRHNRSRNRFARQKNRGMWLLTLVDRVRRASIPIALLCIGAVVGAYGVPWLQQRINQPIEKVIVEGDLQYLERRELMEMVPVYQGDRWLDVSLRHVQAALEQQAWIYSVRVSRRWPQALHIQVQEQKPIARWNEDYVLNQYGQIFERQQKNLQHLPLLSGSPGSERNVMERFLEFSQTLSPLYVRLVKLRLNERLSWEATLDNGVVIRIGHADALLRMRRFVRLYRQVLADRIARVESVDLRYTSGAAVRFSKI
jgi:cell division protein FtsQ